MIAVRPQPPTACTVIPGVVKNHGRGNARLGVVVAVLECPPARQYNAAMKVVERIRQWYRGTYIPPPPNDPNAALVFLSMGHYEQPALAKALGIAGRFWLGNWKWIITTALAAALGFAKFH